MIDLPRAWYLSITTPWREAAGFAQLREAVEHLGTVHPPHQTRMPEAIWHHTMLAILRIDAMPADASGEGYGGEVLRALVGRARGLSSELSRTLRVHALEAEEVVAWDAATSVRLRPLDDALAMFRSAARAALAEPVAALCTELNGSRAAAAWASGAGKRPVTSLLDHPEKSTGGNASACIARSPFPGEAPVVRWRLPLPPIRLTIASAYVVCSDQALSNPRALVDGLSIRPASLG